MFQLDDFHPDDELNPFGFFAVDQRLFGMAITDKNRSVLFPPPSGSKEDEKSHIA